MPPKQQYAHLPDWVRLYPKQMEAFNSPATELYFGGASEGGKSFFGRYMCIALCTAVPDLQIFIFRKYYGDCISNHMDGPSSFKKMLEPWIEHKLVTCTENEVRFNWNNAQITMHGILHDKDLDKHVGREKHVLWLDEAGQIPKRHIDALRAWVRMPLQMREKLGEALAGIYPSKTPEERRRLLPRILYTSNPEGPSLGFFRRQFVHGREPKSVWQAADKDGGFIRQFIPSFVGDNPAADAVAQRRRLLPLGENRARALIEGDHAAPTGDFFKEYDDELHVVPDFHPAPHLFKFRTFDWGSNDPAAVLWWCVADDETFIRTTGGERHIPKGALIAYREWYICDEEEPQKGAHMRNEDIARGILERTKERSVHLTFCDRFPFADRGQARGGKKWTMADDYRAEGVPLTLANVARVYGWKQLRSRLIGEGGVPLIYFTESCKYVRDYLPALSYHPSNSEDASEDGEATHICDAVRYACTLKPIVTSAERAREQVDWRSRNERLTVADLVRSVTSSSGGSVMVTRR